MAISKIGELINDLIEREEWQNARLLIERELNSEPDNHWLLTQLGETYCVFNLDRKKLRELQEA